MNEFQKVLKEGLMPSREVTGWLSALGDSGPPDALPPPKGCLPPVYAV